MMKSFRIISIIVCITFWSRFVPSISYEPGKYAAWRCTAGVEETKSCGKEVKATGCENSHHVTWCVLKDQPMAKYHMQKAKFKTCCGGNGTWQDQDTYTQRRQKEILLDTQIEELKAEKVKKAHGVEVKDTETILWMCLDPNNNKHNDSATNECADSIRSTQKFGQINVPLLCYTYKSRQSCDLRRGKGTGYLPSFKFCCGGFDLMRKVVVPRDLDERAKIEANELSEYEKLSKTDFAFACGNKTFYNDGLTVICAQLAASSVCWTSEEGREWCHIRKNKEWDRRYVQEDDYIFGTCCDGEMFEQRLASEVPPIGYVANTTMATTTKPIETTTGTTGTTTTGKPSTFPVEPSCSTICVKGENMCGIRLTLEGMTYQCNSHSGTLGRWDCEDGQGKVYEMKITPKAIHT